jgi:hypothetical protein
MNKSF